MAPTSRFEKPATRVYSSPKPTQPDSSTIGEANFMPQKSSCSEAGGGCQAALWSREVREVSRTACMPRIIAQNAAFRPAARPGMFHVILFQPEIPPNTGNSIRLCANTGAHLHLVEPLDFNLSEPQLKRAGLDYHDLARVSVHKDLAACLASLGERRLFVIETDGTRGYHEAQFQPGDCLLFGRE